ncbi:ATP-binding cassette domain-containing protein, partial [Staphylococcus aureus]|nr:ATP-binding cassette domain-containing protein [Staphylococcus aureus]
AQGLSLHLGKRQIIDNVSVALRGGEMTVLIGPNGAGKSTLLHLLTDDLAPVSGTRHLPGKPLEAWSPEALSRRRAVLLQRTALQADWTVETVIAMGRPPWGPPADPAVLAAVSAVPALDRLSGPRPPRPPARGPPAAPGRRGRGPRGRARPPPRGAGDTVGGRAF